MGFAGGEEGCVGPTEAEGHAKALGRTKDDVGAQLARRLEQNQGHQVGGHGHDGALGLEVGDGAGNIGDFTAPLNGQGGRLQGIELTASLPLDLFVDALQGYPQGGELYLTGGGAASATWLQIIADCTGRTVVSSAFNELSARGAAILAARSVAALAETPPLAQTRYQPRPQAHARYAALYPVYRLLREQMLPVWQARQAALQRLSQEVQP